LRVELCVFLVFFVSALAIAPLHLKQNAIQNHYIVVFLDTTSDAELTSDLAMFQNVHNLSYTYTYDVVLKGFAAYMDKPQLMQVRNHPRVKYVEQDQVMRASQTCNSQSDPCWGLTRVSQRAINLVDKKYPHASNKGDVDIQVYIIDTGIYTGHNDFQGRARWGTTVNKDWTNTDQHGHGTHVASTVGGLKYGISKHCALIAVRVLGPDGSGTTAGVIQGVNWAVTDNTGKRTGVGNMSLGGGKSQALNDAVDTASLKGVIIVCAAGNENQNACNVSPASATNVVTVGASSYTTSGGLDDDKDTRASFSNFGPSCVSLFAPGTAIDGAWIGGNHAENTISGTSMASPHVAGVCALLLAKTPDLTFQQLHDALLATSTSGAIDFSNCGSTACQQSPNKLLYHACE